MSKPLTKLTQAKLVSSMGAMQDAIDNVYQNGDRELAATLQVLLQQMRNATASQTASA